MNILSVSVIAIVSAGMALSLKKQNPQFTLLISLSASLVVLAFIFQNLFEIYDKVNTFTLYGNYEYLEVSIKALAITVISSFISAMCDDAGDKSMAFAVKLFGKTSVILIAIPLLSELFSLLMEISKL